ncbi:MAG: 6-bladed beta-propeller [Gemmatimonadales bacterium]
MNPFHPAGLALTVTLLLSGCGSGDGRSADRTLHTVIDSTGDTIVARTEGDVAPGRRHTLQAEVTIAPAADDTSLFTEVYDFEVDRAGRFWVFDRPSSTVFLFSPEGQLLRRIGRRGAGPGEFRGSNGMVALPDSGVAILDASNARVSFLDAAGDFRTSWRVPSGFSTGNGLVADRSRRLYLRRPVTGPREGEILGRMGLVLMNEQGELADSLIPPDLDVPRELYVAVQVTKGGQSQSATGARYAPGYYWAWHPDGYFVVANGGTGEIILARPAGQPLVIRRSFSPVPVNDTERDEEAAMITWQMRRTDPAWTWNGPDLPRSKAPLLWLTVTRDGRIWTRVAVPSERIPDAEVATPVNDEQPVSHYRNPEIFEVYEPDGRFLGRIDCHCRISLVDAEGDTVWGIVRDENDLPAIVRFRVEPGLEEKGRSEK